MPFLAAAMPALMGAGASIGGAMTTAAPWLTAGGTLASMFGGGGGKAGSPARTDVITMPQYSFTEPRLRLQSDFISSNLQRIGEGKFPAYYDNASPMIRESMARPLYQTYFGRPGDRTGTVQAAMEASAIQGSGARSGTSQVNKALARYEDASKAIDEFIAKTGVDVTQQSIGQMLGAGNSMPKGPDAQIVSYGGIPGQSSSMTDSLASMASMLPYLNKTSSPTMPGISGGYGFNGDTGGGWNPSTPPPGYNYNWQPQKQLPAPTSYSSYITPGGNSMSDRVPDWIKQLLLPDNQQYA